MAGLIAPVEDGKIVETNSQSSLKKANSANNSGMDKEAFLQLLVAQMQYQDPLEPTSNTEYIAQYAQFSQVEALSNMAGSMDLMRASGLVGQEVYIKTMDSTGNVKYVDGKVDYVVYENGKAFLSIDESLYSIDDLDTVADPTYLSAYKKARAFVDTLGRLPGVNGIGMGEAETIDKLEETYNNMTDYEKTFIAKDVETLLNKYIEKLKEIRLAAEQENRTEEPGKPAEGEEGGEDEESGEGGSTGVEGA